MALEIPLFGRCCFCVPLRYGLLVWGYLKLVAGLLSLVYLIFITMLISMYSFRVSEIVIIAIFLLVDVIGIIMNVLFIVAAHMKNNKLLKVYYRYGIVSVSIYFILYCIYLGMIIHSAFTYMRMQYPESWFNIAQNVAVAFVDLVLQIYLLLLLRSEIFKLNASHKFQFTNLAAEAEAQCVMTPCSTETKSTPQTNDDHVPV